MKGRLRQPGRACRISHDGDIVTRDQGGAHGRAREAQALQRAAARPSLGRARGFANRKQCVL
eukprot:11185093-Lingulodinium_polyedra.AAC.1